jgi:hypothetical protein
MSSTHSLESEGGMIYVDSLRKRASDRHLRSEERWGREKSGHGKKSEKARVTHILKSVERVTRHGKKACE